MHQYKPTESLPLLPDPAQTLGPDSESTTLPTGVLPDSPRLFVPSSAPIRFLTTLVSDARLHLPLRTEKHYPRPTWILSVRYSSPTCLVPTAILCYVALITVIYQICAAVPLPSCPARTRFPRHVSSRGEAHGAVHTPAPSGLGVRTLAAH